MAEQISGPTWLKIGGLLSGVAALLTAIVTGIATLVAIWPEEDVAPRERDTFLEIEPSEPEVPPNSTEIAAPSPPRVKGEGLVSADPDGLPSGPTAATSLVRYEGDGCFYPVTILEKGNSAYRVRFPFDVSASVVVDEVRPARPAPLTLQPGNTVFVPGERVNSQAKSYPSYKVAIIDDILRSMVYVRFEPDDPCPVSHELLAVPASEVLTIQR